MKHPISIPRRGLSNAYKDDNGYSLSAFRPGTFTWNVSMEMEMEQTCPLTHEGIMVNTDLLVEGVGKLIYTFENNFCSMMTVPIFAIIECSSTQIIQTHEYNQRYLNYYYCRFNNDNNKKKQALLQQIKERLNLRY
jgi:hypothetical protein